MPTRTEKKRTRLKRVLCVALLLLAAWPALAWAAAKSLVTGAELAHADALIVLSNPLAYVERTQHAARLWREGRAPVVLLTDENLRGSWSVAQQRNPLFSERAAEELRGAGVPPERVIVLPDIVTSTYDEALRALDYAKSRGLRSVLIVTSAYHSRRALWVFRRVFDGSGIVVGLDAATPGQQSPRPLTWWCRPSGWKTVALEYPKLVYYWLSYRSPSAGAASDARGVLDMAARAESRDASSAPELTLAAPVSSYVGEVVLVDARRFSGVTKLPQADGTPSIVIDFGDGATANLLASGHAYRAPGTYTISFTGKDAGGKIVAQKARPITVTEIPPAAAGNVQALRDTGNASANGANLQQAINRAARRNAVEQEIVLPARAKFAGTIVLTAPEGPASGQRYITIRTSALGGLPPSGARVKPTDAEQMAVVTAPASSGSGAAAMWTPYPAPPRPSHHYRLQGIHFKKDSEQNLTRSLLTLGDIDPPQDRIAKVPHHFIVERCLFDGGAGASELTNGVRVAADHVSIADSHLAEFRVSAGVDTAAISIVNSQGPYSFVNNLLVATSENVNFGGGRSAVQTAARVLSATKTTATLSTTDGLALDQNIAFQSGGRFAPLMGTIVRSVSGNQVTFESLPSAPDAGSTAKWGATPSYAELRGNHFYKPVEWWASHPSYAGRNWVVKNLFETKDSRYLLLDGNLLENHWQEEQSYAVALAPRNQEGNAPFSVVRDIQFSNNHLRNLAGGIGMLVADDINASQVLSDVTLRHNLFENVGYKWDRRGVGHWLLPVGDAGIRARRIVVVHNTVDLWADQAADHYGSLVEFGQGHYFDESFWAGNAMNKGWGGIHGYGAEGSSVIKKYLPPGTSANWNRNMIAGANPALYPPNGFYPASWPAQFINYRAGDFTLAPTSPGKTAAPDATDVGVNMTALKAATSGAVSGVWSTPNHPAQRRRIARLSLPETRFVSANASVCGTWRPLREFCR